MGQTLASSMMRHILLLLPCLVVVLVQGSELEQGELEKIQSLANVRTGGDEGDKRIEPQRSRVPKVFYVTTQSSTTTLTTNTICWVSLSAISIVCGRKKRFINFDPIDGEEENPISPSNLPRISKEEKSVDDLADEEVDLDGSIDKAKVTREGKFLVYWMTTTSISTITSFSSTYSLASIICTPSNYAVSQCG